MELNESEFFIAFIFKNFTEKSNVMIVFYVSFYTVNNGSCPFYDKILEAVALI
jgi:hypothetical protein